MTPVPCVVSAAEHAGWAHLLCVAAPGNLPAVIERRRVALIDDGLPTMPYHHESLGMTEDAADALIARVRASVAACTSRAWHRLMADLAPSYAVVALAIREPPFAGLPETVAVVRQSYPLQCAADGMIYQQALCHAARESGLPVELCRRGEEIARAAARLAVAAADMESFVAVRGRPAGPPWTQELRRAYAAGIATLASHGRQPLRISIR